MGASETKQTPSGNSSCISVAMAIARRVLPTPPVPVRVRNRTSGRKSRVQAAAISRSRPIREVSDKGSGETGRFTNSEAAPPSARCLMASFGERRECGRFTMELASTLAVGAPVPAPALVSRLLTARREGPDLAAEGEGRGGAQPGIPGGRAHGQPARLSMLLVEQGIFLYHRHSLIRVAHVRLQTGSLYSSRTV